MMVTDSRRGGAPIRCATIAEGMAERGWDVMVVSVLPAGAVLHRLASKGIATADLALAGPSQLPRSALRLRRLVHGWAPDVVQTSLWHANVLGRLGLVGVRCPVIGTVEGLRPVSRLRRTADRATLGLAAADVAVCQAVADRAAAAYGERPLMRVIRVGVDLERWSTLPPRDEARARFGIPAQAPVVAWNGRFDSVKNLPALMRVVGGLPGWWLVIGGAGDPPGDLGAWVSGAGLRDRFVLAGELDDVRPVLAAADVFAMTSLTEAMPLALVEAMAAGLPVVAPAVGGLPEIITSGRDGLLVAPGDEAAMARALDEARKRSAELGAGAIETVRGRFALTTMLDAYDRLWRELASPPRQTARSRS
jgi:glycosyltransferase involved in cell wall biosynthesis